MPPQRVVHAQARHEMRGIANNLAGARRVVRAYRLDPGRIGPPKPTGSKRISACAALDAIIFRQRSGGHKNQLPTAFPDDSSVHRTLQLLA
jgi:hypothetical protein